MDHLPLFLSAVEATRHIGQNERTIRRRTLRVKLPATKHGSQFKIAPPISNPFETHSHPPNLKALLTRLQALENLEDVQASQASRLTDLERQVFLLLAKPISELETRFSSFVPLREPGSNTTSTFKMFSLILKIYQGKRSE